MGSSFPVGDVFRTESSLTSLWVLQLNVSNELKKKKQQNSFLQKGLIQTDLVSLKGYQQAA